MGCLESGESSLLLEVIERPKLKVLHLNTFHAGRAAGLHAKILDFIYREKPDVVLLQEVFEDSLEGFGNALNGQLLFSQMCRVSLTDKEEEVKGWGVAIGFRHKLIESREDFYHGSSETSNGLLLNVLNQHGQFPASTLLQARIEVGSDRFNFGTTHFTWVRGAEPSDEQLQDFLKLTVILDRTPDLVLTGDFNSPRGYPIFDRLAGMYQDNIPANDRTTLDSGVKPEITWEYVIDGFFTSQHYLAKEVRMVQGLSDHQGILAEVQRVAI